MGDMRVHELAKEFGMENKEFLARLIDMKIPVKSHSSTLNDAFVARIRKQLEPELAEQAAAAEAERQAEAERKAVEERLQKEAIEAERRKAVKEERARRAKERAEKAELSAEPSPAGYDWPSRSSSPSPGWLTRRWTTCWRRRQSWPRPTEC